MEQQEINGAIEAMLFIAESPLSLKAIASALGTDADAAKTAVDALAARMREDKRGILIFELDGAYQLCTNPEYYAYAAALNIQPPKRLTMPLLETLAIIAYKQPVCKADIEAIRGVDATHAVNKLLEYELIKETGRSRAAGRPILFGTSDKFHTHFGLSAIGQLPNLDERQDGEPQQVSVFEEA